MPSVLLDSALLVVRVVSTKRLRVRVCVNADRGWGVVGPLALEVCRTHLGDDPPDGESSGLPPLRRHQGVDTGPIWSVGTENAPQAVFGQLLPARGRVTPWTVLFAAVF